MNILCKYQLKISFKFLKSEEEFSFDGSEISEIKKLGKHS